MFAEADGAYTAGCAWQWYRVLSGCVCIITWVRQNMFGKLPRLKHGLYSWPELVPVILLLAASKFLSITWFDLNEISPLRIALG